MAFITQIGQEEFYLFFIGFLQFTIDSILAQQVLVLMSIGTFMANCMKNHFKKARPSENKVWTNGTRDENSYAFPSRTALNGTAVPIFTVIYFSKLMVAGSLLWLWLPLSVTVTSAIGISRIYLGVSTPGDVLAGSFFGSLLVIGWSIVCSEDWFYAFIGIRTLWLCVSLTLLCILLLMCHPHSPTDPLSQSCYKDSCSHVGTGLGTLLGAHLHHRVYGSFALLWGKASPFSVSQTIQEYSVEERVTELVKRVTIVIAMLVLVLTIVKKLIKSLVVGICRCFYIPYVPYSDPSQVMVLQRVPVLPATDAQISDLSDSLRKQWIAVPYAEVNTPWYKIVDVGVFVRCLTYSFLSVMGLFLVPAFCFSDRDVN